MGGLGTSHTSFPPLMPQPSPVCALYEGASMSGQVSWFTPKKITMGGKRKQEVKKGRSKRKKEVKKKLVKEKKGSKIKHFWCHFR